MYERMTRRFVYLGRRKSLNAQWFSATTKAFSIDDNIDGITKMA